MPTAIYDPDRVAATVRRLRAEQGMHQTELAKRAGLSRRTVVAIEAGGRARDDSYGKVAAALGVPLAELLGEEN